MRLSFAAVWLVVVVGLTASVARGQFEILSVERRVEITHPDFGSMNMTAGASPTTIDVGRGLYPTPENAAMPYASQYFSGSADRIWGYSWVRLKLSPPAVESGTADSSLQASFRLTHPIIAQLTCGNISVGAGSAADPGGGVLMSLTGANISIICDESNYFDRIPLAVGDYTIELSATASESQPAFEGRLAEFRLRPIPEPSTWAVGKVGVLALFAILRARRKRQLQAPEPLIER
jgi:hypothetical protein